MIHWLRMNVYMPMSMNMTTSCQSNLWVSSKIEVFVEKRRKKKNQTFIPIHKMIIIIDKPGQTNCLSFRIVRNVYILSMVGNEYLRFDSVKYPIIIWYNHSFIVFVRIFFSLSAPSTWIRFKLRWCSFCSVFLFFYSFHFHLNHSFFLNVYLWFEYLFSFRKMYAHMQSGCHLKKEKKKQC